MIDLWGTSARRGERNNAVRWIGIVTAMVGLFAALLLVIVRFHEISRARSEARKAAIEEERAASTAQKQPPSSPVTRESPQSNPAQRIGLQRNSGELDGEWRCTELFAYGQPQPVEGVNPRELRIEGTSFRLDSGGFGVDGRPLIHAGDVQYDATSNPKTLTFYIKSTSENAKGARGKVQSALYELKGDTLRYCQGLLNGKRPATFDGITPGYSVQTYRRKFSK